MSIKHWTGLIQHDGKTVRLYTVTSDELVRADINAGRGFSRIEGVRLALGESDPLASLPANFSPSELDHQHLAMGVFDEMKESGRVRDVEPCESVPENSVKFGEAWFPGPPQYMLEIKSDV